MIRSGQQELAVASPMRTYRDADSGREVRLIGMVHFGSEEYYDTVTHIATERERAGDAVHYEGVTPASDDELRAAPPLVRVKAQLIRAIDRTAEHHMHRLNGTDQADKFVKLPTWENHDITELQIAARLGLGAIVAELSGDLAIRFVLDRLSPALLQELLQEAGDAHIHDSQIGAATDQAVTYGRGLDKVVIGYRNQIALDAHDQHAEARPDQNLVMIWGIGHLAGLGAGLEARGYDMVAEDLITPRNA